MDDKQIILNLGGTSAVAKLLGISQQRVNNWMTRGIPSKVKLENQDLFVVKPRRLVAENPALNLDRKTAKTGV